MHVFPRNFSVANDISSTRTGPVGSDEGVCGKEQIGNGEKCITPCK